MNDSRVIVIANSMAASVATHVAFAVRAFSRLIGIGELRFHIAARYHQLIAAFEDLVGGPVAASQVTRQACLPMGFSSSTAALGGPLHPEHGRGGGSRAPNSAA